MAGKTPVLPSYRKYHVTLTGLRPLLLHADNLPWQDKLKKWQKDPENKKLSVAGDDRSPAWTWIGCLYSNPAGVVGIPSDNLQTTIREASAMILVPGAKGNKTFKAQSQSGMMVDEDLWPLLVNGQPVHMRDINPLMNETTDFEVHEARAKELGFELFVKRAAIGKSKHVRVRPRFEHWSCSGTIIVFDDMITTEVVEQIFSLAGRYKGLGDWRPSAKTPGAHGTFSAEVELVEG